MFRKALRFLTIGSVALMTGLVSFAFAEETTIEKVQAATGDAKVSTKKAARKVRKKVRDATGNDSVVKDAKDSLNNAGDDVSNAAKKAKNKVD